MPSYTRCHSSCGTSGSPRRSLVLFLSLPDDAHYVSPRGDDRRQDGAADKHHRKPPPLSGTDTERREVAPGNQPGKREAPKAHRRSPGLVVTVYGKCPFSPATSTDGSPRRPIRSRTPDNGSGRALDTDRGGLRAVRDPRRLDRSGPEAARRQEHGQKGIGACCGRAWWFSRSTHLPSAYRPCGLTTVSVNFGLGVAEQSPRHQWDNAQALAWAKGGPISQAKGRKRVLDIARWTTPQQANHGERQFLPGGR